jgi:anhydro-N-acetylmuramic acid kinase
MKVIGLMSGTSVDGIDTVLVEITGQELDLKVEMLAGETFPYPEKLRETILAVCAGKAFNMAQMATLDDEIAEEFAKAALKIQVKPAELIGSHGQTVFHRPAKNNLGYSVQLGRGALIANQTGITTVSNFRQADIAAGGQGAPLVPAIDAYWLGDRFKSRVMQNIGGIGNLTYIPAQNEENWTQKVTGWDTGPGNALLDLAVQWLTEGKKTFDENGQWAAQGTPNQDLVAKWLKQPFFQEPPPKSTGRELFSEEYLQQCWQDGIDKNLTPADFLATLTELTVASIVLSYSSFLPEIPAQVLLCGGGSRNQYLKQRLITRLAPQTEVLTTDDVGVNGDFKEAIAFAILAYWRLNGTMSYILPLVTGAKKPVLLGEVHFPMVSNKTDN